MSDRFIYLQNLGRGGFGKITLLYDRKLQRKVVEKSLIEPTPDNCRRLIREGKVYITLKNIPFIIDIIDYSFDESNPYLLLPYYEKGTLQSWVGKTNWFDAIASVQNVAAGLRAVHELGGFHRDIKPSNLFVDEIGNARIIKLGDFGIGRLPRPFTRDDITRHACGTDGYIAPELYLPNAKFTTACDIYSLGVTGIELITGSKNPISIYNVWINNKVKDLLLEMTSIIPSHRPNAETVMKRAKEIVENHQQNVRTGAAVLGTALIGGLLLWASSDK
jgi:serine/threonine protein kinase